MPTSQLEDGHLNVGMRRLTAIASRSANSDTVNLSSRLRPPVTDVESEFVFSLARATTPQNGGEQADRRIANWSRVLQLASEENAIIALRQAVSRIEGEFVPPQIKRQLALLSLNRELRMRQLQARLEELLIALNRARIDVLLLKGGALAATVYGSFAARPMRDIDLLVRPGRADEARALMLDLGWAADPELPGDRSYKTHHHLPPLCDPIASGLRLEIHRSLLPTGHPFRFTEDEIWSVARPAHVGVGRALVMHPAHQAVHIAMHFAWSHMMKLGALNAFRDLDALDSANLLDWGQFAATAARWGASSCCYWTLRLGRELSDLAAPDSVLCEQKPRLPEIVCRSLTKHFVNNVTRSGPTCPSARLDRALWSLAMQPGRDGHGGVRPWLVSLDLLFAFSAKSRQTKETSESPFLLMRRTGRYISEILA